MDQSPDHSRGTHSLYDWQLSTLMLAYDASDPLPRADGEAMGRREQAVMQELQQIAMRVVPAEFWKDGTRPLTPQLAHDLTKAVIRRAAEVIDG